MLPEEGVALARVHSVAKISKEGKAREKRRKSKRDNCGVEEEAN